ncbi:unnamed protein product, partial [marine sediment metagenome]
QLKYKSVSSSVNTKEVADSGKTIKSGLFFAASIESFSKISNMESMC